MLRNYLTGVEGKMINTIPDEAVFNMMKILPGIRESVYLS